MNIPSVSDWVLLILTISSVFSMKKSKDDVSDVEEINVWPMDLEPNSQIIFRPLFVYKQKKAEQNEEHRRKAEAKLDSPNEGKHGSNGSMPQQTITYQLQRPSPVSYYPYYYYYQYQHQYPTPHYHYANYPYSLYSYYQNPNQQRYS